MYDAEQEKIEPRIASMKGEETMLLRKLRAVRGKIEEEKRKLEVGE